jgi:hypothetical protein
MDKPFNWGLKNTQKINEPMNINPKKQKVPTTSGDRVAANSLKGPSTGPSSMLLLFIRTDRIAWVAHALLTTCTI